MSASTDLREAQLDRELERIMKLTDDEVRAEIIANGEDPDALVAHYRQVINNALAAAKRSE